MYLLKTYKIEDNEELYDKCQELVVKYKYIFNDSRKSKSLKDKVQITLFQIYCNLVDRQSDDLYNYILLPQSKNAYATKDKITDLVSYKSVKIAQEILISEKHINFKKSLGYKELDDNGFFNASTSTATLSQQNLITPTDDFLENIKAYSTYNFKFSKPETILHITTEDSKYWRKKVKNVKAKIKKAENNNSNDKDIKLLNKWKNDLKLFQDKCEEFPEDRIAIEPNIRLNKYNKFLCNNGLSKFQMQRVFGNNISEYGRCFSMIHQIKKEVRQSYYGDSYIEADFSAFTANVIYLIETGCKYKSRYKLKNIYSDIVIDFMIGRKMLDENRELEISDDYDDKEVLDAVEAVHNYYREIFKYCLNLMLACHSEDEAKKSIRSYLLSLNLYNNPNSISSWYVNPFSERVQDIFQHCNTDKINFSLTDNEVIELVSVSAPVLVKYFYSDFSKISQHIESETLLDTLDFCVDHSIIAFGIHDAVICSKNKYKDIKRVMEQNLINNVYKYLDSVSNNQDTLISVGE